MSAICQANLTEAQDIGYNCKTSGLIEFCSENSWMRQMSEVHCAFSAANVNMAIREYRHELMLLATEQHY